MTSSNIPTPILSALAILSLFAWPGHLEARDHGHHAQHGHASHRDRCDDGHQRYRHGRAGYAHGRFDYSNHYSRGYYHNTHRYGNRHSGYEHQYRNHGHSYHVPHYRHHNQDGGRAYIGVGPLHFRFKF